MSTKKTFDIKNGLSVNNVTVIDTSKNVYGNAIYASNTNLLTLAQAGYNQANTGTTLAQAGYNQANTVAVSAQSAFDKANNALPLSGGTVSGNTTFQQNLTVLGSVNFTGNVSSVQVTGNTGQFFGYSSTGFSNPGGRIILSNNGSVTFAGGGATYYNLLLSGSGTYTITGANTFGFLGNTGLNSTLILPSNVTTTVIGSNNFNYAGNTGYQAILKSSTPGVQATLYQSSGIWNSVNTTIQDINATGGATWNALLTAGNVDNGNNTGWNFIAAALGNFLMMFI